MVTLMAALGMAAADNPWLKLQSVRELPNQFDGPSSLTSALQSGGTHPLSLASADLDEDGVADLICGFSTSDGGLVEVFRGNLYSIYPNAPGAKDHAGVPSAFLSPARVFETPVAPDFVGAGDFDADGHRDVVIASTSDSRLYFLRGNGNGTLNSATSVRLQGNVTAMVTGEMNRRDGLDDIVVATEANSGATVSVFEGPQGALKAKPETFAIPSKATSMALGQLDDHFESDLAIAAGSDVLVIHGRDRKLTLEPAEQNAVPRAAVTRQTFPFQVVSLAPGHFSEAVSAVNDFALLSNQGNIVLLDRNLLVRWDSSQQQNSYFPTTGRLVRTRTTSLAGDDLLALDSVNHRIDIVNSNAQANDSVMLSGNPVAVLNMRLNKDALDDLVILREGSPTPEVVLTAPAHIFVVNSTGDEQDCDTNDNVCSIDGDTITGGCQPGACTLRAAIKQANNSGGADEIDFSIGSGHQTITAFAQETINDTVTVDGTTQPGFAGSPLIQLDGSAGPPAGSTLGASPAPNSVFRGLDINQTGSTAANGLFLINASGSIIEGNYIGTDVTGTVDVGNGAAGIEVQSCGNVTIGGTTAAARNIISGNTGPGITFGGTVDPNNVIEGNYIGTDVTGTLDLGNDRQGISDTGQNTLIGGTTAGAGNVISGNGQTIIESGAVYTGDTGMLLQGNLIGTDVTGTTAIGDGFSGVYMGGTSSTVGGTTPAARNVISGNLKHGILVGTGFNNGNLIEGNYIGTDVTGTSAIANGVNGVECSGKIVVGGTASGAGNVISGNGQDGIGLDTGFGTTIQGNLIGTQADGVSALGNTRTGVRRNSGTGTIGGTATGAPNVIAFNGGDGIVTASGASASANSIYSNTGLGIDFNDDGVTTNQNCNVGNFPVITSAVTDGTNITITGTLNTSPSSNYTIEFFANTSCDPSGNGEGATYLGTVDVTTDNVCNASFNVTFTANVPVGSSITATSTPGDLGGNGTSEFSACVQAVDACIFCDNFNDQDFNTSFGPWTIKKGAWSPTTGDAVTTTSSKSELKSPDFGGCTNCTFETDMKMSAKGKMALYAWYQDDSHYVFVLLLLNKGKIQIKQKNGSLAKRLKVSATLNANTFYNIKVTYNGANFQVSLNDVAQPGLTMTPLVTPHGNAKFWVKSTTGAPMTGTYSGISVTD